MTGKLFQEDASRNTKPVPPVQQGQARAAGCRGRAVLWLLVLLLLVALATLFTIMTSRPEIVGLVRGIDLQATNRAIDSTVLALQSTDQDNLQRGLNLQNTQAALDNFALRLAQTETQQMLNNQSTNTAVAVANAAQATQAARDFQNTQVALQQVSTRIQAEFEATQTALGSSFATIEANRPLENVMLLQGNFVPGVETASTLVPSAAWGITDTGALLAQTDHATALLRPGLVPANYTVEVRFTPPAASTGAKTYDVLFGLSAVGVAGTPVNGGGGYALRLTHANGVLTGTALYAVNTRDLATPTGLTFADSSALTRTDNLSLIATEMTVSVVVDGSQVGATVNGLPVLNTQVPGLDGGDIGVQVSTGTQLHALVFTPRN